MLHHLSNPVNPATESKRLIVRHALRYGVGAGIICIIWVIVLYLTDNNPYGPKRLLSVFVPPLAALLCQWVVRRSFLPDGPGFRRVLMAGILTTVLAAVTSATGVYGFARATGQAPIDRHLSEMKALLEASKDEFIKQAGGQEQYERAQQSLAHTPQALASDDFEKKLLFGLILSFPGAVFFRK
ncbi:DUF4199 domain-containing protein [Hymenobacter qilianensis]|uniref:DUF4199 domain-containing protein n=2 Tax=Hymenobacter qilianensis TaxID=1385715 RepID=A0A7H0GRV3_9BACT|nr:DUF4199 domain-containing protein [Hymenobacter qilianensis]QNP51019.1 DUF4199 domain-containing protein [Hymenobacter qilianensis]